MIHIVVEGGYYDYCDAEPLAAFVLQADAERMAQEHPSYFVCEVPLYDKGARTPQPVYKPPPRIERGYRGPSIASSG